MMHVYSTRLSVHKVTLLPLVVEIKHSIYGDYGKSLQRKKKRTALKSITQYDKSR